MVSSYAALQLAQKCEVKPLGLSYGDKTSPPAGLFSNFQPVKENGLEGLL
jgi:hypothetical protein